MSKRGFRLTQSSVVTSLYDKYNFISTDAFNDNVMTNNANDMEVGDSFGIRSGNSVNLRAFINKLS